MHPIVYAVDLFVDREIGEEFEAWLFDHRLDMLAVDGFLDARVYERQPLDEDAESTQRLFSVEYSVRDREALDCYLREGAASMRAAALARFDKRFSARRAVLERREPMATKAELYQQLARDLPALLEGERDLTANLANTTSLLYERLPGLNWVGCYFPRGRDLVLGPFQGRSACVRIPIGKGVCGHAAAQRKTVVVPDVHAFSGHIACDARSRSEIVVPLLRQERLFGVLDLDSPLHERFDAVDAAGLERVARIVLDHSEPAPSEQEHA